MGIVKYLVVINYVSFGIIMLRMCNPVRIISSEGLWEQPRLSKPRFVYLVNHRSVNSDWISGCKLLNPTLSGSRACEQSSITESLDGEKVWWINLISRNIQATSHVTPRLGLALYILVCACIKAHHLRRRWRQGWSS